MHPTQGCWFDRHLHHLRRIGALLACGVATIPLACCTLPTATRQSVADIRARETILFSQPAFHGITPRGGHPMVWQGRTGGETGDLVLTPTTLYFVYHAGDLGGSRSIAISYAAITDARVASVHGPPLRPTLIPGRPHPLHQDLLVIRTVDGGAGATHAGSSSVEHIAFHLIGTAGRWQADRAAALKACSIINRQRQSVGAFGTRTHGGSTGLTTDSMSVINWQLEQSLEQCGIPKAAAKNRNFNPPGTTWNDAFNQQCRAAAERHPAGRHLQALPAIPPSSNFTSHAEKVSRQHPGLDHLAIVSLRNTRFTADGSRTRVTATYTFRIEYHDLRPAKPGTSVTLTHTVTRSAREWVAGGHACIRNDLKQVAHRAVESMIGNR